MADLILTIPDNKVQDFKAGFLAQLPVPTKTRDDQGNPIPAEPLHSDLEWITLRIREWAISRYKDGKGKLAKEAAIIDKDIIQ